MAKRKPAVGDKVSVRAGAYDDSPWREGVITDLLAMQFTITHECRRHDGGYEERVYYAFYVSENTDWRFVK